MNGLRVQQELEKEGFGFIIRNINTWKSIYTYKWAGKELAKKEDEGLKMYKWEFYKRNSAVIVEKKKPRRCNSLIFSDFAARQSWLALRN